ncbi:hypothetical protein [Psychrobacter immobilis]|uniref:hypothetical protein n=1 Tax=Psychrobacter immobilis TaxID=498 RepID=UPI00191B0EA1|nr:hypothetical protein [Psychrobacter immobilis]
MNKQNLSLSLLIGAALTIPSLAMAAPTQTDVKGAAADNAVQVETARADSEMGADQSSPFAINETQRISRSSTSSINNNANPQAMPTELQTQQPQQDMPLQAQQQDMQDPENMQNPDDMQDPNDMMIQEEDAQQDMMQEEDSQDGMAN